VSQSDCASTLVDYRSFKDVLVQSVVLTLSVVVLAHVHTPLRFYVVFIAVWIRLGEVNCYSKHLSSLLIIKN
jgi:hypothetical protein